MLLNNEELYGTFQLSKIRELRKMTHRTFEGNITGKTRTLMKLEFPDFDSDLLSISP